MTSYRYENDERIALSDDEAAALEAEWAATNAAKAAERDAALVERIREEAGRRILARYPDWMQRNMIAEAVTLAEIGVERTPEQNARVAELNNAWAWVAAIRDKSNELESARPADFSDDSHWPY